MGRVVGDLGLRPRFAGGELEAESLIFFGRAGFGDLDDFEVDGIAAAAAAATTGALRLSSASESSESSRVLLSRRRLRLADANWFMAFSRASSLAVILGILLADLVVVVVVGEEIRVGVGGGGGEEGLRGGIEVLARLLLGWSSVGGGDVVFN